MACSPNNPCARATCNSCKPRSGTTESTYSAGTKIDSQNVIYKGTPGAVSKLTCLKIGAGSNLEVILEKIDRVLCERGTAEISTMSLPSCFSGVNKPASFTKLVEQMAGMVCQLQASNSLSSTISQLLASSSFINSLGQLLATNSTFLNSLLANSAFMQALATNQAFINALVNNTDFTTALAQNANFVSKLEQSLLNSSSFINGLVDKIVNDPDLKSRFCCDTGGGPSPCAGMIVNGVQLTNCDCVTPSALQISEGQGPFGTPIVYTLSYGGTLGSTVWTVEGGTISAQTPLTATATFSGSGTITATVTGCDGQVYTVTKPVTATCVPVSSLQVSGPADMNLNQVYSYTANHSGPALGYQWTILGGTITGPTTGKSVNVNWNSPSGEHKITVTATDCTGTAKMATLTTQILDCLTALTFTGPTENVPLVATYTAFPSGSGPFEYAWVAQNGQIQGSSNNESVTVNWDPNGGLLPEISVTVTACGESMNKSARIYRAIQSTEISGITTQLLVGPGEFNVSFDTNNPSAQFTYQLRDPDTDAIITTGLL